MGAHRLAVVIPAAHNAELTGRCLELATNNAVLGDTVIGVWDNGVGFGMWGRGENLGNYPVFFAAREVIEADVLLFIHNDLLVWESGYDRRIVEAFTRDSELGLVGFVGSDQMCPAGGRGWGAWSNFQGLEGGSPAEAHGKRNAGLVAGCNMDGCALAFRRSAMPMERPGFPPHHFYDRLFCCEVLEAGWHVAFLGIACDHLNGQTANVFDGYHALARAWVLEHNAERTGIPDQDVYLEAEHQFLTEYASVKRFIPLRVGPDHTVYHLA